MRAVKLIVLCLLVAGCNVKRNADQAETQQKFDTYYAQWQRECNDPKIAIRSDTRAYTGLPAYRAIVALGASALPYLQKKMEDDRGLNFMLAHAVVEINRWSESDFASDSEQHFRDLVLAKMRAH